MKKLKLSKVIASLLIVASVLALNPVGASAEWKQDSNGWWNTEGSSWSVGWRQIDGKWYYFGQDGYMVHDTTIDGYNIGSDGTWIQSTQNSSLTLQEDENITEDYVKSQGYKIITHLGEKDKYTLEKLMLYGSNVSGLYGQIWGVQKVDPDKYFGKQITVYGFKVKNHPLEKIYNVEKTSIYIMICDDKVIGGYSIPDMDYDGGFYSLDGKTLEEVTGLSCTQWAEEWEKKYEN